MDDDEDFLPDIPDPFSDTGDGDHPPRREGGRRRRRQVASDSGDDYGTAEDEEGEGPEDPVNPPDSEDSLPSVGYEEEVEGGEMDNEESTEGGAGGQEDDQPVTNVPVSGFRVRVGPDGEEVFEFASDPEELSDSEESEDGNDADWQERVGVEPAVEFALPEGVVASIAHRVYQQRRRASVSARRRIQNWETAIAAVNQSQASTSSGALPAARAHARPRRSGEGTSRKKRRGKKAKSPKKKVPRIASPPKPLGPLVISEEWDGNDNHKEYLRKISKPGFRKIVINVRDDQEDSKSSSPKKRLSFLQSQSNEAASESQLIDVTISQSESGFQGSPTTSGISGYKITQLQFDRCSTHQWTWRTKSELLAAHPGVMDLLLYVSDQPGASVLHMKTKKTLRGEAISERPGPPPKLTKRNSERELIYDVTEHYFYHVDPVGVPVDLLSNRGLGNRRTFTIDFNQFNSENQSFIFDVVLLESAIMGDHGVEEIPAARNAYSMQEVFTNFLGVSPPPDPAEEDARQKEDINWFYGQIKKYHLKETLPAPDVPIQPSSLKPTLRQYQRDAVNWMMFREGSLDHCVAHSSSSYINRVDLISAFLDKMYIPVQLTKHGADEGTPAEIKQAFYNPYTAYLCWKKPNIPAIPSGGILCDEMGLGKTVETLSLILLNQKPSSGEDEGAFVTEESENDQEVVSSDSVKSSSEASSESSDSDSSEDSSRKRKRKKSNKKSKQKKAKKKKSEKHSEPIVPFRSKSRRRRALSPCEFTVSGGNDKDGEGESSQNQLLARVPTRKRSQLTTWEAIQAKVTSDMESKSKADAAAGEKPKPMKTYDALKILYDSALNEHKYSDMAKSTPKFYGRFYETNVERREFFECLCGESEEDSRNAEIVKCSICSSSQHAECVGFDTVLKLAFKKIGKSYLCPHCEAMQPPLETKSTLIITPQSISRQWIKEIQRHVQNNQLNILFYKGVSFHGYIPPVKLARYDIVITTYNVLSSELDYVDLPHCNSSDGRRFRNPKRFLTIPSPLPNLLWWRVCLDEAQMVEGIGTKMSIMAMKLQAVHRWCVTGTPINKGLQDLFGLFVFLQVNPISYDLWWNALVRDSFLRKETNLLYELFGQMIWRNGKQDVLDQLGIPPQTEIVHWLNFSPVETHFYKQQFEIGSQRIMDKISRLQRQSPEMSILNARLTTLDRFTLHGLLAPFLELRQACCHPQIVKGQLISLQKGTLSMEELLDRLVKKTQLQCHEDHRLIIAALNGMAGLQIILDNWLEASEKYRQVLQSAEKYKDHFQTDSLQLLHAMENLAEILDGNHDGIPFTLRDESLRSDAAEVRQKYMRKYADAVKSAQNAVTPLSASVESTKDQFTMRKESWWVAALKAAQKTQKIDSLIQSLKQDIMDVMKKNIKNTQSLANKFHDRYSLELALVPSIMEMDELRDSVLQGLEELQTNDPKTFVESAISCHLRQKSNSYYNDSGRDDKCKLCSYHDNFLFYESVVFKHDLKNKIDRTGRNFQQRKLLGDLADELTEKTKGELLQQEAEDLKATTEHVQLINEELRRGTWGDSETEVILKGILRFAKINKLEHEIGENGSTHIKVLEAMKKEFRFLRILWRQIYDQVSALDELSQATTRLIAVRDHIENVPEPSTSSTSRNVKALRSGIVEKTLKIQNIHVIGYHEIEPKLQQMQSDFTTGQDSLAIHTGQLLYLKTLKRNGYGKKGTINTEDCPICSTQLGKEWSVLRCGHSYCSDCVKKMCPNALQYFLCPLCRHSMKFSDVSFVDTNENEELRNGNLAAATGVEPSNKVREVKGSHSTKVAAIVETLLQLQETHPAEKCIIFSTWSEVLDIIAAALGENDIKFSLLNQSGRAFHTNLDKFKEREDLQVLLMPLTSGSKGLNIIEATHVLLVEPILNLASELQAIGRVHRIGQTKPTFVHRFYIKRTIEEKLFQILKVQDISSDEEGSLTVCDLKDLVSTGAAGASSAIASTITIA